MCGNCKEGKCKGGCVMNMITKILVIVGGINWGLVGVGMLLDSDWNVVKMVLGGMSTLEAVVYLLVGLSAVIMIFGCKCKKCADGSCGSCKTETTIPEQTV